VKEWADKGYKYAVCLDLSKYFDTLCHELLMNMIRQDIKDKRLIDLIKKYLKSGVMENGIVMGTEEGSPQGENLSPLLANIYLDKFDKGFESRGVRVIRYADDILLLAKRIRAAERLLGTSAEYLEKKLKLKVNTEKNRAVSVYSIRKFGFLDLRWERIGEVHISECTQNPRRMPKKG
jgi:retron-type reverse transcriptase